MIRICEEYNQQVNSIREIFAVENPLKSQIIGAIEPIYIKELINSSTESILHDKQQIFTFLFDLYGRIDYNHLKQEENKIKKFNTI